jgi:hypothetical protein
VGGTWGVGSTPVVPAPIGTNLFFRSVAVPAPNPRCPAPLPFAAASPRQEGSKETVKYNHKMT